MGFHRWRAPGRAWSALKPRVRELRQHATPAEALLWERLRAGRLDGFRFRRQHAIGGYIVDFWCAPARLAIELDGSAHSATAAADTERTRRLAAHGVTVLRFSNGRVRDDTEGVLREIAAALHARRPGR